MGSQGERRVNLVWRRGVVLLVNGVTSFVKSSNDALAPRTIGKPRCDANVLRRSRTGEGVSGYVDTTKVGVIPDCLHQLVRDFRLLVSGKSASQTALIRFVLRVEHFCNERDQGFLNLPEQLIDPRLRHGSLELIKHRRINIVVGTALALSHFLRNCIALREIRLECGEVARGTRNLPRLLCLGLMGRRPRSKLRGDTLVFQKILSLHGKETSLVLKVTTAVRGEICLGFLDEGENGFVRLHVVHHSR
mmetsp:Transcript_1170/g.2075  ORF Transcript_1170/g.2075 Transcript_1170/m.2075 type:complete len:248 (-) Transcript_1170:234-977(-)